MQLFGDIGYMQSIYSSSLEVMKFMCNMFSKYIYIELFSLGGGGGNKKDRQNFLFLKDCIFAIHIEPVLISMVSPGQKRDLLS